MSESEQVPEWFECQYCERKFLLRIKLRMHEKAKHPRMEHYPRRNEKKQDSDEAEILGRRHLSRSDKLVKALGRKGKARATQQETTSQFVSPASSETVERSSSKSVGDDSEEGLLHSEVRVFSDSSDSGLFTCPSCPREFVLLEGWVKHFTKDHIGRFHDSKASNTTDDTNVNVVEGMHEEVTSEATLPENPTEYVPEASVTACSASRVKRRSRIRRKCFQCVRSFPSVKQYRDHMARHRGKLYSCYYCSAKFSTIFKKNLHIKFAHSGPLELQKQVNDENLSEKDKEICEAGFTEQQKSPAGTSQKEWSTVNVSHAISTVVVQETDKSYDERFQTVSYKCEHCSRQFGREQKLKAHIRMEHTQEEEYEEETLTKEKSKLVPETYIYIPTSVRTESQEQKKSKTSSRSSDAKMNRSLNRVRCGYKCYKCSSIFQGRVELIRHYYQNHPKLFESPGDDDSPQEHLSVPHDDDDGLHPAQREEEIDMNGVPCINEKPKDGNNQPVVRHLMNKHQCTLCHFTSFFSSTLTRHILEHHKASIDTALESAQKSEPSKVSASIAPASSMAKGKKRKKRKVCPYCSVDYDARYISTHLRKHTGEEPYSCHLCTKSFHRKRALKNHIYKYHMSEGTTEEGQVSAGRSHLNKKSEDNTSSPNITNPISAAPAGPSYPKLIASYLNTNITVEDAPHGSEIITLQFQAKAGTA